MKKRLLIYPLIISLFPVVYIFSRHVNYLQFGILLNPVLAILAIVSGIWILSWALLRNGERASLVASVTVLTAFAFGHFYRLLLRHLTSMPGTATAVGVLLLWIGVIGLAVFFSRPASRFLHPLTRFFSVFSALLMIIPVLSIAQWVIFHPFTTKAPHIDRTTVHESGVRPNFYYIILDGYARGDVLEQMYGYSNEWFLDSLRTMGFRINETSQSNYGQTMMSIASSLNFSYIDSMVPPESRVAGDRRPLRDLIEKNEVLQFLKGQKYTIACTASGYTGTELRNVDLYVSPPISLNDFEQIILRTSTFSIALDVVAPDWQYALNRERIAYALDHVPYAGTNGSLLCTFVHIVAPHPPFVFGRSGEKVKDVEPLSFDDGKPFVSREAARYIEQYRAQLDFIDTRVLSCVAGILTHSKAPPVIILQSDHGPGLTLDWVNIGGTDLHERLSILNAWYLPDSTGVPVVMSQTPVNTFRILFNRYFGTTFASLSDASYFSSLTMPYRYRKAP